MNKTTEELLIGVVSGVLATIVWELWIKGVVLNGLQSGTQNV
jgi:hypothetical protein